MKRNSHLDSFRNLSRLPSIWHGIGGISPKPKPHSGLLLFIPKFKLISTIFYFCFIFTFHISLFTFDVLSQQPTQEWVRRYNGLMSGGSSGLSVKLDDAGNVYVLTRVSTPATLDDFGVIKYSPAGSLLWEGVYNSPGNLSDQADAFEVTGAGDVYITGSSGINFEYHITTVKFNSSGILQWAKVYDGGGTADGADDIKADNLGNVIIVGGSAINSNLANGLAIKYDPGGDSLWVRKFTQLPQYSHNSKLIFDNSNNIYIIGYYGDSSADYLILKYNFAGLLVWYNTYNSPPNYSDIGIEITIDITGMVYVIGTNFVPTSALNNTLIKLNSNGALLWDRVFTGIIAGNGKCQSPKGIAVSQDGSAIYYTTFCVNGTGGGGYDIVTLSYNSSGDSNWVRRYWGGVGAQPNEPTDLKLDKIGNIYVSARAIYAQTGVDYTVIKYLPNGNLNWVCNYVGLMNNSEDSPRSLLLDTALSFYLTGTSGYPNLRETTTIKYNQALGITNNTLENPTDFALLQNYPNPFNSSTVITYQLSQSGKVELALFNLLGQKIKVIKDSPEVRGTYNLILNFDDLSSGIFFLKMSINGVYIDTKKLILSK